MIKRMFIIFVPCMLAIILLSGCTGEFKSKTVIISDADESTDSTLFNEDFEVNKIYQLFDNKDLRSETLGWFDNNHVLRLLGGREASLELVNYKDNSRQNLQSFEGVLSKNMLSPNGLYMVSVHGVDGKLQVTLLDLQNDEKTVMEEIDAVQTVMSGLRWSNNSRYVSFAKTEVRRQKSSIVVYDLKLNRLNTFDLTVRNERNTVSSIKLSDHGKHAVLVIKDADESVVIYGKLEGTAYTSQYEFPISSAEQVDYVNEDQILFISQSGSLTIFDRRNASSTIILNQIGIFQLSRDRKTIAYSQERENIFAATLQGNHIMNNTLIYKGMFPYQMKWSPDDRKILISSRNLYNMEVRIFPAPAEITEQVPFIQTPFIIEFK